MICATAIGDLEQAREAFNQMPRRCQNEILSNYLLFRIALRSWDHQTARECIERISANADKDEARAVLYACVREAQQTGDKLCALTALKEIATKIRDGEETPPNLPIILRCAIRLLSIMDDTSPANSSEHTTTAAEDICVMFEIGKFHYPTPFHTANPPSRPERSSKAHHHRYSIHCKRTALVLQKRLQPGSIQMRLLGSSPRHTHILILHRHMPLLPQRHWRYGLQRAIIDSSSL